MDIGVEVPSPVGSEEVEQGRSHTGNQALHQIMRIVTLDGLDFLVLCYSYNNVLKGPPGNVT